MRMRLALALLLAASAPVTAEPFCTYVSETGDIAFHGTRLAVAAIGGETVECETTSLGTGVTARLATCGDLQINCQATVSSPSPGAPPVLGERCADTTPSSVVFSAKSSPDKAEDDLLIFMNRVWYLTSCGNSDPA